MTTDAVDAMGQHEAIDSFRGSETVLRTAKALNVSDERLRRRSDVPEAGARAEARIELLGSAAVMTRLHETIRCVAASSAPAFVTGESGSGKDVVARAIHARGPRSQKPFVAVNVSAIPDQLLESEIFGHVRGAFSGANESRRGLFVAATGGTLFLDEIGDMPLGLQAKLLGVIERGEVRAIGSDASRAVDVRIVAATHRDLPKLIETGRFREDLYFRLNVLSIAVPPLRDRSGDIPELARHFLAQARARMPSSPVRTISAEAEEVLCRSPWPGNVRELSSTIERLVVFGLEAVISVDDLGPPPDSWRPPPPSQAVEEMCTLRDLSLRHVERVLAQTGGDKVQAAAILGINLSTLYRWQHNKQLG